jgi:proteasome accessory factor B
VRGDHHQPNQIARVRVQPRRAGQLRRLACNITADPDGEVLGIEYRDIDSLAGLIAGAGSDAIVLEPPALMKSVIGLLEAAAGGRQ